MRALFHVLILVILGILIVQNVSYASEPVVIERKVEDGSKWTVKNLERKLR